MKLRDAERNVFSLAAHAVFINPFDDERGEINARLGGESRDESGDAVRSRTFRAIDEHMSVLEQEERADLRLYEGADRETISYAFLFDAYHRFKDEFDRLICDQIAAGDSPCDVPFALDALALLRHRGFEPDIALRHFAMFFQIRRAFYFIDHGLVGTSSSMKQLRRDLWNDIFTSDLRWYDRYLRSRMEDFSTLLLGETGCGKGSAAAAIGRSGFIPFDEKSGRFVESFTRAFVSLNLSQYPESLIESELFGHRKGAFTGAVEDHLGVFARCSPHGSIFLDEIGDVSVPIQIKLLQVLQERTFCPVGSHEVKRFRGRVIAATNRSIDDLRDGGVFRDDFFYRLCSDIIVVPPLRQHLTEDPHELDLLVEHCIERMVGEECPEMSELVKDTIRRQLGPDYAWPGNFRELEQCVRRIVLKRSYEGDRRRALADVRDRIIDGVDTGSLDAQELLSAYCTILHDRHGTYEHVARLANLDRRTVKKYILHWNRGQPRDGEGAGGNGGAEEQPTENGAQE